MNKKRKKQRIILFILFLCIPILACYTSKIMFSKVNKENSTAAIKIENKNLKKINSFTIYSIQVGSLSDYEKVKLIQKNLNDNQIPNYVLQKEGVYKIYTYTLLEENKIRQLLEKVKEGYGDAFIAKFKVPGINLEYTDEYAYMEEIQKNVQSILENMKKESEFWYQYNMATSEYEKYISIINERKKIVDSLTKNMKIIKKEETKNFENNLKEFSDKYKENIKQINAHLANSNMYSCEKLFLESVFDYYNFINNLKSNN